MIGIDADYGMSRAYDAGSWPTFIVVDANGIIRFHGFDSDRQLGGVRACLRQVMAPGTPEAKETGGRPFLPADKLDGGIAFSTEVVAARQAERDRWPRLAFSASGAPWVVFYSNRDGTNAVYLRRFNQQGEALGDERLSPPGLESYAADCASDSQGTLWTTWCAKTNRFYDIYVQARTEGKPSRLEQLTFSDDDAMSPKIAAGPAGSVTVTYYKWAKLNGISRDRNIFARTWDAQEAAWGREVEISPPQPAVEDHSDPDVVIDKRGRAWIVWSFDYHSQLYKEPLDADQPTIFAARFAGNTASAPVLVGASGQFHYAIDFFPSAALDAQGILWCAWDCNEPRRCIRLARLNADGQAFRPVAAFEMEGGIASTPELSPMTDGRLLLAWSERSTRVARARWQGKIVLLKDGRRVASTVLKADADVLFPEPLQAPNGEHWVAYEKTDSHKSEILLRNITAELEQAGAAKN